MERLALLAIVFFGGLWAVNGALKTAPIAGRKGYDPRLGALAGALTGFFGGLLPGLLLRALVPDQSGIGVLAALFGGWIALMLLWRFVPDIDAQAGDLPTGDALKRNIVARHIRGKISRTLFITSIVIALLALTALLWNISDRAFGLTAVQYGVEPEALTLTAYDPGAGLGDIQADQASGILAQNVRPVRLQEMILEFVVDAKVDTWDDLKSAPLATVLGAAEYPSDLADVTLNDLTPDQSTTILTANLDADTLTTLAYTEAGRALSALSSDELIEVLVETFTTEELQFSLLERLAGLEIDADEAVPVPTDPLWQTVKLVTYSDELAQTPFSMLTATESARILVENLDRETLDDLIKSQIGAGLLWDERPLVRVMRPLEELTAEELANALAANLDNVRIQDLVLEQTNTEIEDRDAINEAALGQVLQGMAYADVLTLMPFGQLNSAQGADILMQNMSLQALQDLVSREVGLEQYEVGRPLNTLLEDELAAILSSDVRTARLRVLVLELAQVPRTDYSTVNTQSVADTLTELAYPEALAATPINQLTSDDATQILVSNLDLAQLQALVPAEAQNRIIQELPETTLAEILAENVSLERLHALIVNKILLADNPDWPDIVLESVLSPEQASDILMRNLDRDDFEALVLEETDVALLAKRSNEDLIPVLANNVRKDHLQEWILSLVVGADPDSRSFSGDLTWLVLKGDAYSDELGMKPFNELTSHEAAEILVHNLPRETVDEVLILESDSDVLSDIPHRALGSLMAVNVSKGQLRRITYEQVVGGSIDDTDKYRENSQLPLSELLDGKNYPESIADMTFSKLSEAQFADLIERNLSRDTLEAILFDQVIQEQVAKGWSLYNSLLKRDEIEAYQQENLPRADIKWRSWVNAGFLENSINYAQPDATGVRPALYGSLMIILITILFAFPIGVGTAIYLEEYAGRSRLHQIIQTNINNLAGVPSIIYGMLGLAIFVRTLEGVTSGRFVGVDGQNGRTVLSAGATLALLILPVIIINAQEAIRAVPNSLRQASYGLGATKWQTIWNHVLPNAMPGILTGTILAISRAIGETAPLILVGGATYLTQDPDGPFAQFTALPLVIYRLTTLPQDEFRNAAAAAIVVLLALLLTLNSIAVILRNRFSRRLS